MINRSSPQGRCSTEEDSNTMTPPTFKHPAARHARDRRRRPGRDAASEPAGIDNARFWVGAALTAGVSALVALIALIISNDLLHIPVVISEGGRLVMIGFGGYAFVRRAAAWPLFRAGSTR